MLSGRSRYRREMFPALRLSATDATLLSEIEANAACGGWRRPDEWRGDGLQEKIEC